MVEKKNFQENNILLQIEKGGFSLKEGPIILWKPNKNKTELFMKNKVVLFQNFGRKSSKNFRIFLCVESC